MKIVSIEPTPSPNSMKLNMDEHLPEGTTYNFTPQDKEGAPEYIKELLNIEGIKGVFQVNDFIALERHPKADWKKLLPEARKILGEATDDTTAMEAMEASEAAADDRFGEVKVEIQMFKGIPMQVKLTSGSEERRYGLPQRFGDAAMKAQPAADNLITDRQWVEQDPRYGEFDEIGEQVVEELSATYDEARLNRLVEHAFQQSDEEESLPDERSTELNIDELLKTMDHPDWKVRYAALEQIKLTDEELPVIEKALDDPRMSVKRLATAYLGEYDGDQALPLLYKALKDSAVAVRRTAGDAISDIGDPRAQDKMIESLQDPNKLVRWRAARYLYEVGDERAVPALKKAQNDPEFEVSLQIKIALERIEGGHEAEGTVWQQMTESFANKND